MSYIGAVEKIANGQQCGQDVAQGLVCLQLVHSFLQVLERLCYFLMN